MREMCGQCVISVDPETTKQFYDAGWRIICFSESNEYQAIMPDIMLGSLFLPPYESMDHLLDGRLDVFSAMYTNYLYSSPEVETMVSIILTALYQGINIVFFIPKNEYELNFAPVFSAFLSDTTGVVLGAPYTAAMYNTLYNDRNMLRLYSDGFMLYSDLLVYHDGVINDPYICTRMCGDIGFITEDTNEAVNYITAYKNRIRNNNNTFLPKGFIKG